MTIWILAVLLLASTAGLGLRQGVIRVAFSLVGILVAALLAVPLGHLIKPGLAAVGVKNPVYLWLIPPGIAFVVVLILFKIPAQFVHRKVEVYFKYKAGDLRLALWERLSHRLGLCLGLFNGAAYLVLISFFIYTFSYWTIQLATSNGAPKGLRILNQLGRDLQSTGLSKAALAIGRMPPSYYEAADIAGIVYHTPLLEARLHRYPAFLGLAERSDFQDLYKDQSFTESWQKQAPIMTLINNPKVQAILKNPSLLKTIWATVEPNLQDLQTFLKTGRSPKYDPVKILGRWDFDVNGALGLVRRTRPKITYMEMKQVKEYVATYFPKTQLVATPDQTVYLKNFPHVQVSRTGVSIQTQNLQGQWRKEGETFQLTFTSGGHQSMVADVKGDRLFVMGTNPPLAFQRED